MTVIAVKKWCVKNGRVYGPYPKDSEVFYLYRVYRDGDEVKQQYLGKGHKPRYFVVQEDRPLRVVQEPNCRGCRHFTALDSRPFCQHLQGFLSPEMMSHPHDCFEEGKP